MRPPSSPAPVALSVIIPSLNEAKNLALLLPALRTLLPTLGVTWEVIVVDGNSLDNTREIVALNESVRFVLEKEKGYGRAILRGIGEANGEYVLTMDADLSHPAQFIRLMWEARGKGDIIIASRYVAGGKADQPWLRFQLSKLLNRFFRIGLSIDVKDMSSGYRLYRKSLFQHMKLEHSNFVMLVEILLKAYAKGMHTHEVPFHYQPRKIGRSNAQVVAFGLDYLRLFRRMWAIRNSIDFPDYDWRAYDSRIWFQRYWQRKRHDIIIGFVPPGVDTCDVGCGSSRILADLPHAVGVDLRHDKLAYMRKCNKRLAQGDGMRLPFSDAAFDCVISSEIIEHIPEENGRHIDELVRVLKPGGILVLGTPDYGGWQWPLIEWVYARVAPGAYAHEHVTHYSFRSLKDAIETRGCTVLNHGYICKAELIFLARKDTGRPA